jgi:excinuclease ABC subunit A
MLAHALQAYSYNTGKMVSYSDDQMKDLIKGKFYRKTDNVFLAQLFELEKVIAELFQQIAKQGFVKVHCKRRKKLTSQPE